MSGLIVTRAQWGAMPAKAGTPRPRYAVDTCFIHYSDVHESVPTSLANECAVVRAIQRYHMSKGYVDIAYEGLIGQFGNIYEGRAGNIYDASTCNNNRNGYGLCVLTDGPITAPQAASLRFSIELGHLEFLRMARTPKPHSAACATACPGDAIRHWIAAQHW